MKLGKFELAKAIYSRLTASTEYPVYREAPGDEVPRYIEIGSIRGTDWSTMSNPGQRIVVSLHAWDRDNRNKTDKYISEMMQDCLTALTVTNDITTNFISLDNFHVIRQDVIDTSILDQGLDSAAHGVIDFEFWL